MQEADGHRPQPESVIHLLASRTRLSAGVTTKSRACTGTEKSGGRWPGKPQGPGVRTKGAPPSFSHGRLHAAVSDRTPSVVIRICCSRAGQPEARSVAPTSAAVSRRRTPPRMTADQASGALAFETIAANRTKERDAIDAGSARCFGHVAAGLLEQLRNVLTLEALE